MEEQRYVNRFGLGLSPACHGAGPEELIAELSGGPEGSFMPRPHAETVQTLLDLRANNRMAEQDRALRRQLRVQRREDRDAVLKVAIARGMAAKIGFAERLVWFWHDHFVPPGLNFNQQIFLGEYLWSSLRPHVAGRFADLARTALLHPLLLASLDQINVIGPNAARRNAGRNFNENFAREMLELHLLGVDGPYNQSDIKELAELLTGLRYRMGEGLELRPDWAEPGTERVLGQIYGGDPAEMAHIEAVIEDLARHPQTIHHLSWKLCRHFVADQPDAALVAHLASTWQESDGDLTAIATALLEHPAALRGAGKIRRPIVFVIAALRAMGYPAETAMAFDGRRARRLIERPLAQMGQRLLTPSGPNGWPEDAAAWITADRLAARMSWALTVPRHFNRILPDPRQVAETALRGVLDGETSFAVSAAESRPDGLGLLFASPAFNRV